MTKTIAEELYVLDAILADSSNRTAGRRVDDARELLRGLIFRARRSDEPSVTKTVDDITARLARAATVWREPETLRSVLVDAIAEIDRLRGTVEPETPK